MGKITKKDMTAAAAAPGNKVDFDGTPGEVSSSSGVILALEVGAADGPFTITRIKEGVEMVNGGTVTLYDAVKDGVAYRLPIGAIFGAKAAELRIKVGDVILIRREPDVTKAKGVGKGRAMTDWTLKVISRAPAA